jgi:hypothetical protein
VLSLVSMPMEAELPWLEYTKARLPRGFSHAVGRDAVERALRGAGAEINFLDFGPPFTEPGERSSMVFDVFWIGDGGSRIYGAPPSDRHRLLMRWNAVPAEFRAAMATEIVNRWLPEACTWAATAPGRGNVWRATDHRWMLLQSEGELTVRAD